MCKVEITETKMPYGMGYLYKVWLNGEKYNSFMTTTENRLTPDEIEWSRASYERAHQCLD